MKLCECGCGEPAPIAKMTNTHYGHVKGQPVRFVSGHKIQRTPAERFWPKVSKRDDGCWEWTGARLPKGYGYLSSGGRGGHIVYAHRLSYEMHVGPIPENLVIDHVCHNPWCVNPNHLEPVTVTINVRRQRSTKLTSEIAKAIRRSTERNVDLARRYNVDASVISRVRSNDYWR